MFALVDQAGDFVRPKLDRAVGTRAKSNQAPETYELPADAVSEAVFNAFIATTLPTPRFRSCSSPTGWKFGIPANCFRP